MAFPWVIRPTEEFPQVPGPLGPSRDLRPAGTMADVSIAHEQRPPTGTAEPAPAETLILSLVDTVTVHVGGDEVALGRHEFLYVAAGTGYRWQTSSGEPWNLITVM